MNWSAADHGSWNWAYNLFVLLIAGVCGCCNYYHVSTMFENDRHFSHLSTLERDLTFRTEMGLYYSFYKRIVQAPSFFVGLNNIMNDNFTEYPTTVNTLQRFNLYPEIALGAAYRGYMNLASSLGIKTKECWQVDRGEDLPPVWSCEGLGDPSYFYLTGVWLCAGTTASILFLYGLYLSKSFLGGLVTILSFFFNHSECTRVQWTPPLRESFTYPIILAQLLSVSWCLRQKLPHWKHLVVIALTTSASLVTWQFSQFVFLTQVAALVILWLQNQAPRPTIIVIFLGKLVGLQNAVLLLFANEMLLTSFYSCAVLVVLGVILFLPSSVQQPEKGYSFKWTFAHGTLVAVGTLMLRFGLQLILGTDDDAHIFNLLRAKFTSYRDFHTLLYICAAEFDFLSPATLYRLSKTLLLPAVYVSLGLIAVHVIGMAEPEREAERRTAPQTKKQRHSMRREKQPMVFSFRKVDPAVLYNVLQMAAFVFMAALIMRLKLFMSPHLCIFAGLLASRKYVAFIKSPLIHWALVVALISGMSVAGLNNLQDQQSIIGEYSNPEMEELVQWIAAETPKDAAFAGPMPLMASVLLTTHRPIVNHPHYEGTHIRERTKKVYRAFGRGTVAELYRTLVDLKVSYLVLGDQWCYGESRPGCSMLDIWDVEEPQRKDRDPLCPILFEGNPSPLQRVFSNDVYVVLRVPSRYVEVTLPRQYRQ